MQRVILPFVQLHLLIALVFAAHSSTGKDECLTLHDSVKEGFFSLLGLRRTATDIKKLCSTAEAALGGPCTVNDAKLDDGLTHWLLVARWAACTDAGRRVTKQMGLSTCTSDQITQNRFYHKYRSCKMMYGIQTDVGLTATGLCQAYDDYLTCVQAAAELDCGPAYRDFYRDTITLVSHGEKESKCFPDGSLKIKSIKLSGFGVKFADVPADASSPLSQAQRAFQAVSNVDGKLRTRLSLRSIAVIKSKSKKKVSKKDASSSSSAHAVPSGMMKHRDVIGEHIHH